MFFLACSSPLRFTRTSISWRCSTLSAEWNLHWEQHERLERRDISGRLILVILLSYGLPANPYLTRRNWPPSAHLFSSSTVKARQWRWYRNKIERGVSLFIQEEKKKSQVPRDAQATSIYKHSELSWVELLHVVVLPRPSLPPHTSACTRACACFTRLGGKAYGWKTLKGAGTWSTRRRPGWAVRRSWRFRHGCSADTHLLRRSGCNRSRSGLRRFGRVGGRYTTCFISGSVCEGEKTKREKKGKKARDIAILTRPEPWS